MCIQTVLTACLYVRTCLCMCTHAGIQTGHTCLRGCITYENAAPETCTYMHVSKSDLSLKIEEDVDGAIEMMAQTGPFSVPIRCRRKRCTVSGYLNVHTYVYGILYACANTVRHYWDLCVIIYTNHSMHCTAVLCLEGLKK